MKLERTRTEYSLELTTDDMLALVGAEHPLNPVVDPFLSDKLEKLPGVDGVEYNGHYGAAVYLRIDAGEDTPETHAAVIDLIGEHVAECRDALEAAAAPRP